MKDEKKVEQNNEKTVELFGGKENLDKMEPWDFISALKEAQDEAMKECIRANTIMLNSRLAKVKPFAAILTPFLGAQVPPMICGLEAKLADDLPEEFAFAIMQAPKTERERLIKSLTEERDEWKKRAEAAERNEKIKDRALDKATELAYEYRTEADTLSCSSCPMFHIFDSCKERGLYKDCSRRWKEEILRQAEREIEEEERK